MIYFKSCPKCHGDLTTGRDAYGSFMSCLQCGFMRDIDVKPGVLAAANTSTATPIWYSGEEPLAKAA